MRFQGRRGKERGDWESLSPREFFFVGRGIEKKGIGRDEREGKGRAREPGGPVESARVGDGDASVIATVQGVSTPEGPFLTAKRQ